MIIIVGVELIIYHLTFVGSAAGRVARLMKIKFIFIIFYFLCVALLIVGVAVSAGSLQLLMRLTGRVDPAPPQPHIRTICCWCL
jgi:hypothetical protein